ncbi:MAG: ATP synthase F0 subunit B [Deltaproteobacteria bacterium]|nr:ATP synthase F0 subunit B [Deltaproteobacteria bacterium]
MKRKQVHIRRPGLITLTALLFFLIGAVEVLAAEGGGGWRPTYDLIMKWVNFGILAFIFFKFARQPLKNFLSDKSNEVSLQIEKLEGEKDRLSQRVREAETELEENVVRLEELKERIVQMGERRKLEIIEAARQESRMLIESAKHRMEGRIISARNALRTEMVDAAAEKALEKLPGLVTADDNQRLLEQFIAQVAAK